MVREVVQALRLAPLVGMVMPVKQLPTMSQTRSLATMGGVVGLGGLVFMVQPFEFIANGFQKSKH